MAAVASDTSTIDREVGMLDAATAVPGLPIGTLSREQQAVVDHETGPMLVFAGPGSGKTRTITERIAALIRRGVPAHEILALTFTVRATEEMRVRLVRMLGQDDLPGRDGVDVSRPVQQDAAPPRAALRTVGQVLDLRRDGPAQGPRRARQSAPRRGRRRARQPGGGHREDGGQADRDGEMHARHTAADARARRASRTRADR